MGETVLVAKSVTKNGFNGREVAFAIIDYIPIVRNAKATYETTFGKDPIMGHKLDKTERAGAYGYGERQLQMNKKVIIVKSSHLIIY